MVKDRTDFECVVVGAGILGLSVARSISKRNKKVLVLEKNRRFGGKQAHEIVELFMRGIYYPKNL